MIEVVKIEDFVIEEMFLPFFPSYTNDCQNIQYRGMIMRMLKKNPEQIIKLTEGVPGLKESVMQRLEYLGGVEWYRYLDMNNPVVQWVNDGLDEVKDERD